MINFSYLESRTNELARTFKTEGVFEYVVIDGFCDEGPLAALLKSFPDPVTEKIKKEQRLHLCEEQVREGFVQELWP